ncbi:unnamed protein product, partial [Amoebophrya sp. A25]|eukprot:GSA25T00009852001.1
MLAGAPWPQFGFPFANGTASMPLPYYAMADQDCTTGFALPPPCVPVEAAGAGSSFSWSGMEQSSPSVSGINFAESVTSPTQVFSLPWCDPSSSDAGSPLDWQRLVPMPQIEVRKSLTPLVPQSKEEKKEAMEAERRRKDEERNQAIQRRKALENMQRMQEVLMVTTGCSAKSEASDIGGGPLSSAGSVSSPYVAACASSASASVAWSSRVEQPTVAVPDVMGQHGFHSVDPDPSGPYWTMVPVAVPYSSLRNFDAWMKMAPLHPCGSPSLGNLVPDFRQMTCDPQPPNEVLAQPPQQEDPLLAPEGGGNSNSNVFHASSGCLSGAPFRTQVEHQQEPLLSEATSEQTKMTTSDEAQQTLLSSDDVVDEVEDKDNAVCVFRLVDLNHGGSSTEQLLPGEEEEKGQPKGILTPDNLDDLCDQYRPSPTLASLGNIPVVWSSPSSAALSTLPSCASPESSVAGSESIAGIRANIHGEPLTQDQKDLLEHERKWAQFLYEHTRAGEAYQKQKQGEGWTWKSRPVGQSSFLHGRRRTDSDESGAPSSTTEERVRASTTSGAGADSIIPVRSSCSDITKRCTTITTARASSSRSSSGDAGRPSMEVDEFEKISSSPVSNGSDDASATDDSGLRAFVKWRAPQLAAAPPTEPMKVKTAAWADLNPVEEEQKVAGTSGDDLSCLPTKTGR